MPHTLASNFDQGAVVCFNYVMGVNLQDAVGSSYLPVSTSLQDAAGQFFTGNRTSKERYDASLAQWCHSEGCQGPNVTNDPRHGTQGRGGVCDSLLHGKCVLFVGSFWQLTTVFLR